MQLSPNFFLDEFTRSEVAARLGREVTVEVGSVVHRNLLRLCADVLQPLRDALGPIPVTSGYRPRWLNEYIGGSPTSAHLQGLAADIVAAGRTPLEVARAVVALGLPVDQVIHEYGRWAHVAIPADGESARGEALTAVHDGGRTICLPGLLSMAEAQGRVG